MSEEHSLEQSLEQQQKMGRDLIEIQKRTQLFHSEAEEQNTGDNRGPVYDLYQIGEILHLELELPGVLEKDIQVDLTPDYLTISCKIEEPPQREKQEFLIHKRRCGEWEYLFNLPSKNMTIRIPPKLSEGVLSLELHLEIPVSDEK